MSAPGRTATAIAVATTAIAAAIYLMPVPAGVPASAMGAAALTLFALGLWATGVFPDHYTSLLFFLLAMLLNVAPPATVFAGFASSAIWLVFGGMFIAVAVHKTGLGRYLSEAVVLRVRPTFGALLLAIATLGFLLSFIMPSTMGRVLLLVPLVTACADRVGFGHGSRGRTGLVMAALLATFMPATAILPALVPNMILAGVSESLYGVHFTYAWHLFLHMPVSGLGRFVIVVAVTWLLFRDDPKPVDALGTVGAMPEPARRLLAMLSIVLLLWMTDTWHGISPAWVAMGAGLFLLLPRVGLMHMESFNKDVSYGPFFVVAANLGVARLVIDSGLATVVSRHLIEVAGFTPGADFRNYMTVCGAWLAMTVVFNVGGVSAVAAPLAKGIATATGLPLETILNTAPIGYGTVLLPFEVAPILVGIGLAGERIVPASRTMILVGLASIVVVWPLNFLWWRLVGGF